MATNNQMMNNYIQKGSSSAANVLSIRNYKKLNPEPIHDNMTSQIDEELLPAFNSISNLLKEKNIKIEILQKKIIELKSQLDQQKKVNQFLLEAIRKYESNSNYTNRNETTSNIIGYCNMASNSESNQLNRLNRNFWTISNTNNYEKSANTKNIKNVKYRNLIKENSFKINQSNTSLVREQTPELLYKRKFETDSNNFINDNNDKNNDSANPKDIRKNYLKEVKSKLDSDVYKLFLKNIKLLFNSKSTQNENNEIIMERIRNLLGETNKDLFEKLKVLLK